MSRFARTTLFPVFAICACAHGETPATASQPPTAEPAKVYDSPEEAIRAALAGAHRSERNRARDEYRHPLETLQFFGLRQDSTVVELWPGGGWYTEVLAPVLRARGELIVAHAPRSPSYLKKLESSPVYDRARPVAFRPPEQASLGPPGSADLVLTFRSTHNWLANDIADDVYRAAFDVLKPGGVFGVVQHRGLPTTEGASGGYVAEGTVIDIAEQVGFELDEKSEINANPNDTKDHPKGVWTLPPTLTLGEQDKDKYLAIGESDRMTLRFIKP